MKGLFLYGLNCRNSIWDKMKHDFSEFDIDFAEYPHEVIKNAKSICDITKWVYDTYKNTKYDFIVGHSMGGIIALELAANHMIQSNCIIFIESNLRPAKEFYRNLMLPSNLELYGTFVMNMIKSESVFCSDALTKSLQEDFDYTSYLKEISCDVFGIYGDRGQENYNGRYDDLCLDEDTRKQITFKFVKDACHMPMVENPKALTSLIFESLRESNLM